MEILHPRVWIDYWRRNRLRILMYHSIADAPADRLAVHPQASAPTREIVFDILKVIALERAAMYDSLIHRNLSGQQRAILTAVAQGLPMRSDLKMVAATGIPANTLTSGIRSLRRAGWVMQGGAGDRFDDPFLRMHLLLAAGTKPI